MNIFWFRRDLRLHDNTALNEALKNGTVQPVFIFDTNILSKLSKDDSRLTFIHSILSSINNTLNKHNASVICYYGDPLDVWKKIMKDFEIQNVYWNKDYEPYAIRRDESVIKLLSSNNLKVNTFKDQVIFEENEVLKVNGDPYTIFTPYKNKWLSNLEEENVGSSFTIHSKLDFTKFNSFKSIFPSLKSFGFNRSNIQVRDFSFEKLDNYHATRNFPSIDETSYLGPHLRFGTVSVRECVNAALDNNSIFLSELIWREFFMQILFHFPYVENKCFKLKYEAVKWRNNKQEFQFWSSGMTGFPLVDAGIRQLNQTGYMHNRVRMVVASFLVKHLLIDWRWGQDFFAKKLLDFELSSNNGNWQWAAGTGCDSAPYFRIFNPINQLSKFDSKMSYVNKWIPNLNEPSYPDPIVDHKFARIRCLDVYKKAIKI
ncbi:MAG: deoxyribodipyrimidine photolyase [Flavobacteriales bacterium]|nr:deoxyribodipyrimidine photolyase [Flavobacteriales bacterium]